MAGKHFKTDSAAGRSQRSDRAHQPAHRRAQQSSGSRQPDRNPYIDPVTTPSGYTAGKAGARASKRRHPVRTGILVTLGLVLVLVGVYAGLLVHSAFGMVDLARDMYAQVDVVQAALDTDDAQAMQDAAAIVEEDAAALDDELQGVLWTIASHLPVVGTDIANVRTLAALLDELAGEVIVPAADRAEYLSLDAIIQGNTFNLEAIGALVDLVDQIAPELELAQSVLSEMEDGRIEQLNSAVDQAEDALGTVNELLDLVGAVTPYVEDMLGANGTRTYLILAHNTSELKCSGGFIGSAGTITITDGTFELGDFDSLNFAKRSYAYFGDVSDRASSVTDEEAALFTWTYGVNAGDSGVNPDFSREATVAVELWESAGGEGDISGAIALDTTVLGRLLDLTGSFTLDDGTEVTGDNVVEVVGYQLYWEYFSSDAYDSSSNDTADATFGEVAGAAFKTIVANIGSASLEGLVEAITTSVDEGRLTVWMEDEGEEAAMEALGLAGTIGTDETEPVLGVYLESQRSSKLDWWTDLQTTCELVAQNEDGSCTYAVTTTISNTITAAEVAAASTYIVGSKGGTNLFDVYLYAPAGGSISDVTSTYTINGAEEYTIDGSSVTKLRVKVGVASTTTITYTVTTSAAAQTELQVAQTPTARSAADEAEAGE